MKYQIVQNKPEIIWINSKLLEDRIDYDFYSINQIRVVEKLTKVSYRKLDDLVKAKRSEPQTDSKDFSYDGIDVIRMSDIDDFIIDFSNTVKIPIDIYENLKEFTLKPNTVIFGLTGVTLGKAVPISKNIKKCITNRRIAQLEIKDAFDSFYIATFINTQYGRSQLFRYSTGVAQPNIRLEDTGEILVPIPDYDIQKYIGDKVRKAEELREEAKTLQKEIDILLEVDMLLKEETDKVYNIYDSKINWTNEINIEDRIDPNFYQKKYISTIEKLGNNKVRLEKYVRITKIRYQTGNINKYIEISSINNSFGTIDEVEELRPEEIPTSAKYQVKEGDILVSLVRPTRKAISIVTKEYDNAICTGGFAVLQSKGKVPVEFLTAVLRTNFVGIQFERYCAGSTYPTINEDDVVKVFIPMYSENQINKITENYRRIIDNIYTSKKLIEEAKQDVEDLIEGNFDMSKVKANS
ncbi:restriction endonuclease subunit S [Caproiciproducens sp. LBM24188]